MCYAFKTFCTIDPEKLWEILVDMGVLEKMPVLSTEQMILPVLLYIADGQEHRRLNIINMLTEHFSLTEDEREDLSRSGQMENSIRRRGFIERSRPRHYRITSHGLEYLNQNSKEISVPDINTETLIDSPDSGIEVDRNTPTSEESIEQNYQEIRKKLAEDLLQEIKANSPAFFEELVIDLLVAMGYGGSREDAQTVGRSGDGGIDGIINEDRLGLDVIYVQAKRWQGNVGEPPVRDFVGALQGRRARKGIFITTSGFSESAQDYTATIDSRDSKVILIDGNQLAQLMIDHNVGVSVEKTYEIKRVDSDYFAENTENS